MCRPPPFDHAHRASLGAELEPKLVLVNGLQVVDTALSKVKMVFCSIGFSIGERGHTREG